MIIHFALDWDGTFTLNPGAWLGFIRAVHSTGQTIAIVTMRADVECADIQRQVGDLGVRIFATDRKAKKPFMRKQGHEVKVWIDDNPDWLFEDAAPRGLEQNAATGLWLPGE